MGNRALKKEFPCYWGAQGGPGVRNFSKPGVRTPGGGAHLGKAAAEQPMHVGSAVMSAAVAAAKNSVHEL